jgi:hypothetical protein
MMGPSSPILNPEISRTDIGSLLLGPGDNLEQLKPLALLATFL